MKNKAAPRIHSLWLNVGLALVAVTLMSAVPVIIKFISVSPFLVGAVRLAIAVAGLGLWLRLRGERLSLTADQRRVLLLLGVVFGCHWLTYFYAIAISSASIAAIGISTFGAHLLLLGWILQGHRANLVEILAVVLAMVGVLLVIDRYSVESTEMWGLLLAVLSGFLYALLPVIHQKNRDLPSRTRALGQFAVALVLFSLGLPFVDTRAVATDWLWLAVLGVFCTLIAHSLWVRVSTELPHVVTSVIYYLYVPMALALSQIFLGEALTANKLIGAGLIIAANLLGLGYRWWQDRSGQIPAPHKV